MNALRACPLPLLILLSVMLPQAVRAQTEEMPDSLPATDSPSPQQPEQPVLDTEATLDKILPALRVAEERSGARSNKAFEQVRQALGIVLRADPMNVRARYYEGRLLIVGGQDKEAVSRLQDWMRSPQGVNDWEGHYLLGRIYTRMEFYKLAKPRVEKAIELNPTEPRPYELLTRCETKLANPEGALEAAKQYIRQLEDAGRMTPTAALLYADALEVNKELGKAIRAAEYGKKLAMDEVVKSGGSIPTLAMAEQCIQKLQVLVQKILQFQPEEVQAHLHMSMLLQEQARIGRLRALHAALAWGFRGLELAGEQPPEPLLLDVIRVLTHIRRFDEAIEVAKRGRAAHPTSQTLIKVHERLVAMKAQADSAPKSDDSLDELDSLLDEEIGEQAPAAGIQVPE